MSSLGRDAGGGSYRFAFRHFPRIQHYFYQWRDTGVFYRMMDALRDVSRTVAGRSREPTAAIIHSPSARTTEAGDPCGYDGGKKIKGRKRHIAVDVEGSLLVIDVHPADVQDRDGAAEAIVEMLRTAPTVEKLFADGGYSGPKLAGELQEPGFSEMLEFVFNPKDTKGFSVLYRLWVVERTFA